MRTKPARSLQPLDEVIDIHRLGAGLGVERIPLHDRADLLERLKAGAIIEPRVARTDPANPVRLHAVTQKPNARVRGRLARPEDDIEGGRLRGCRQLVNGYDLGARCNVERGDVGGRNRRLQIASIDDLATRHDIENLSGTQVSHLFTVAPRAEVIMAGKPANSACLRKPRGHIGEVRANLLARRAFVVSSVLAALVDAIPAERERVHPVIGRRGMQANEGIRIQPMTSGGSPSVDQRHLDVSLGH